MQGITGRRWEAAGRAENPISGALSLKQVPQKQQEERGLPAL